MSGVVLRALERHESRSAYDRGAVIAIANEGDRATLPLGYHHIVVNRLGAVHYPSKLRPPRYAV